METIHETLNHVAPTSSHGGIGYVPFSTALFGAPGKHRKKWKHFRYFGIARYEQCRRQIKCLYFTKQEYYQAPRILLRQIHLAEVAYVNLRAGSVHS